MNVFGISLIPFCPAISFETEKICRCHLTERSILFLERFCPNYAEWLPTNAPWDHIPEFQQDKELVDAIQTVNDPAERMCSFSKCFKML